MAMPMTGELALILNEKELKKFSNCNDAILSGITKLPSNGINVSYELKFLRPECSDRGGPLHQY